MGFVIMTKCKKGKNLFFDCLEVFQTSKMGKHQIERTLSPYSGFFGWSPLSRKIKFSLF